MLIYDVYEDKIINDSKFKLKQYIMIHKEIF